jgi:hypothetical protein
MQATRTGDNRVGRKKAVRKPDRPRASAQLDAFPRSANERARQSNHQRAVVSVRLRGATIAKLDDIAKLEGQRRSVIILNAINAYLLRAQGAS